MSRYLERTERFEEERTIQEEFILTSDDAGKVPKTITRDGTEYTLDESSVELSVSKKELWRDQAVMEEYVTYTVEDNDLDRLQREVTKDGNTLELIEVDYTVTEMTQSGLPLAYEARCRYAVNVDQDREVPVEWKAVASYTGTVENPVAEYETEEETSEAASEAGGIFGDLPEEETDETLEAREEPLETAETEALEKLEFVSEVETLAEEAVPMAASVKEPFLSFSDAAAGTAGALFLGAALVCGILYQRKNKVAVHMRSPEGKSGEFLGKVWARKKKGLLVVSLPKKFLSRPGIQIKELVLKPSKTLLRGRAKRAKIVSSVGIFYADVKDTMTLWEDRTFDMGKPTEQLAAAVR